MELSNQKVNGAEAGRGRRKSEGNLKIDATEQDLAAVLRQNKMIRDDSIAVIAYYNIGTTRIQEDRGRHR